MKKYIARIFIILNILLMCVAQAQQKSWTFLVYMAAANDLNTYALYDLQEMTRIGSNSNVNILVYLTIQENGKSKQTKKLYIEKDNIRQIGPTFVRDSGDVATLAEAIQWACLDYPSDHLVVDLWNHGDGPLNRSRLDSRGVCYDYDTGHYLTDRDCLHAFSWIKDAVRGGRKIDIITCDACLLASLELAYTFETCADYYVASQETIPANGYQYAYLLSTVATQPQDALSFAKTMVSAYGKEYTGTDSYTLSALDMNALDQLVNNVNAVAQILTSQLKGKNGSASRTVIKRCATLPACLSFDNGIYIDLGMFYKNLLKSASSLKLAKSVAQQFKQLLSTGIDLLAKIIKANTTSRNYRQATGLSIYFGKRSIDPSYYGLYWTEHNPNWLNFLEAYMG